MWFRKSVSLIVQQEFIHSSNADHMSDSQHESAESGELSRGSYSLETLTYTTMSPSLMEAQTNCQEKTLFGWKWINQLHSSNSKEKKSVFLLYGVHDMTWVPQTTGPITVKGVLSPLTLGNWRRAQFINHRKNVRPPLLLILPSITATTTTMMMGFDTRIIYCWIPSPCFFPSRSFRVARSIRETQSKRKRDSDMPNAQQIYPPKDPMTRVISTNGLCASWRHIWPKQTRVILRW